MDMSSLAPPGQQHARAPVAGRLVVLTLVVAGSVAAWSWLGHLRTPAPVVSPASHATGAAVPPALPAPPAAAAAQAAAAPPVRPATPATQQLSATAEIAAPARVTRVPDAPPSFDVVRVDPHGAAVIAGRSAPGAQVVVAANGHPIARVQADPQGQWVALPEAPLPPGGQQLTLSTVPARPGGHSEVSRAPVIVLVPPAQNLGAVPQQRQSAIAVLTPPTGPARLLQAPAPTANPHPGSPRLSLGTVDYDAHGAIRFAGTAAPNSTVRMYVDSRAVGDATTDVQGRWTLVPAVPITEGRHQLRTDQLRPNGSVAARIALPFERVALPDTEVLDGKVVIQPGENLWRIARHVYGRGIRYTVIYLANRSQIRNPDLIYPGQVFAVPAPSTADVANPASSGKSKQAASPSRN